jgi:hypothetical protein
MGQFHHFHNAAALQEVHLNGHLYMWGNEWAHPTLERIDRVFIFKQGDTIYPDFELQALSSFCSNHGPLLLCTDSGHHVKRRLYFRSFWLCCLGFPDVVQLAWHCPLGNVSQFCKLDWLLHNTVWFVQSWSDRFVGNDWWQLEIVKEVLFRPEAAYDRCQLLTHEEEMCKLMELKSLGLASLQRTITH